MQDSGSTQQLPVVFTRSGSTVQQLTFFLTVVSSTCGNALGQNMRLLKNIILLYVRLLLHILQEIIVLC